MDDDLPAASLLLRVPRACELLAIGRSTLYVLMSNGELDVVHIGRSVRITTASALRYVERQLERAAGEAAIVSERVEAAPSPPPLSRRGR
jgi:excisionase family DNA binding protein